MLDLRTRLLAIVAIAVIVGAFSSYYYLALNQSETIVYHSKPTLSRYVIEYPTQTIDIAPDGIAAYSGNVWFVVENLSSLVSLNHTSGLMQEYPIPGLKGKGAVTWGIALDSLRNLVWFTEQTSNSVWSFNVPNHTFKQYKLQTSDAFPFSVALDSKGDAWFTELFSNKIGEITPSGNLSEIVIPGPSDPEPSGITVDSTGRVWFTLPGINSTGVYYDGKFEIENLTGEVSGIALVGIAVDNSGNLWMTQHGPSYFSEFNPSKGYFRTISTAVPSLGTSLPYFSYTDAKGDVWFNEHYGNAIDEFIPSNNTLIEYCVPTRVVYAGKISGILTMTLSNTGEPWFTEFLWGKWE